MHLFILFKILFVGSKYPKIILRNFENRFTGWITVELCGSLGDSVMFWGHETLVELFESTQTAGPVMSCTKKPTKPSWNQSST